jgi:L-fuculose-phosphate aldolase
MIMGKIRNHIVQVSKMMYEKGMANAFEGNVSVIENDKIYITPSGICKGFLTPDMIVVTDMKGQTLEGKFKPSSELLLHINSYRHRPDIKSVIHAHSPHATAFALANLPIESKSYTEMIMVFDRIPLADYGTPSTDRIFDGVKKYITDYDIILLANHGIMSVGKDVFDAYFKLEAAESIAKVLILARQLGGEKELAPDQLKELQVFRRK